MLNRERSRVRKWLGIGGKMAFEEEETWKGRDLQERMLQSKQQKISIHL